MSWNEKVRKLMEERGINQKMLSELSGITESSVSRYLSGNRKPRIDIIVNFAKVLNVEVDYLLEDGETTMSPYDAIKCSIARYGNQLTEKEQKELIDLILGEKN